MDFVRKTYINVYIYIYIHTRLAKQFHLAKVKAIYNITYCIFSTLLNASFFIIIFFVTLNPRTIYYNDNIIIYFNVPKNKMCSKYIPTPNVCK